MIAAWTDDELQRIDGADELDIAAVRRNGELRRDAAGRDRTIAST